MTTTEPTPTWHPWRTLREQFPTVDVFFVRLPDGMDGYTDGKVIWLDEELNQVQRRCTLTHELWHLRRGILPADAREERICDELAARELIPLGRLIDGFRWTQDPDTLRKHLWVDPPTLQVRLNTLDPIEVAEIEYETNGAWWQGPGPTASARSSTSRPAGGGSAARKRTPSAPSSTSRQSGTRSCSTSSSTGPRRSPTPPPSSTGSAASERPADDHARPAPDDQATPRRQEARDRLELQRDGRGRRRRGHPGRDPPPHDQPDQVVAEVAGPDHRPRPDAQRPRGRRRARVRSEHRHPRRPAALAPRGDAARPHRPAHPGRAHAHRRHHQRPHPGPLMATIEPYDTKAGRRYMVRYRTPDHTTTKKRGFKTKRDAQIFANTVEVKKLTGDYVAPALGRITVDELAPAWLAAKKVSMKPSGYHSYDTSWRVHVQPKWGSYPVNAITGKAVEDWVTAMQVDEVDAAGQVTRRGAGAVVVLRAYGILAGILDDAVKAKRLPKNPARGAENLPRKPQRPHTYLTHTQVRQLAEAADDREMLVYLLAYTGLRWGEATALRAKHVDLLRRRVSVVENAVLVKRTVVVGTPKAHELRTVGLPRFLADMLADHLDGLDRDALVFPGADGAHQKLPANGTGWLEQAVKRAGVPRVTAHDLRHTAASLAVQAGAHVKAVQKMMGHKSGAMTLDVYADLFDDDLDVVADAMDAARGHILGTDLPEAATTTVNPSPISSRSELVAVPGPGAGM